MSPTGTLIHQPDGSQGPSAPNVPAFETVRVWGLALARVTTEEMLDLVDGLIDRAEPGYFITANLHYAMLTGRDPRLAEVNRRAAFLVADGMPLVWYSRLLGRPLPERVTGADSIYRLCQRAARRGHGVFLLGGAPDVARQAAENLRRLSPGLRIVGIETPMLSDLSPREHDELIRRIRDARPELLLVAFGQPKGEAMAGRERRRPGRAGVRAARRVVRLRRRPRRPGAEWMQRIGAEWTYRILREPRRMIPRYAADAVFLLKAVLRDVLRRGRRCSTR